MLLYACQHYVNSCMNIFIHKIFPMLIIYHTRATVATICTLSMIPAIEKTNHYDDMYSGGTAWFYLRHYCQDWQPIDQAQADDNTTTGLRDERIL